MSTVHLSQIRRHLLTNYVRHIDVSDIASQREDNTTNHRLTRGLSAFVISGLCGADIVASCQAITDGSDDHGIDAIYIDKNSLSMYLVQSKWIHNGIGEPSLGDTGKFISGIRSLINCEFNDFGAKIKKRSEEISGILSTPGSKLIACLAYTGNSDLAPHATREIEKLIKEINDSSDYMSFRQVNQRELYKLLIDTTSGTPIDTEIILRHWGKVDEPSEAYYGQISGEQLYNLWNEHGQKILAKNIRNSLGETDVNNSIRETIFSSPQDFWYFNNGITLTAKKISKLLIGGIHRDIATFCCEDISIVNGAQTISTIGRISPAETPQLEPVSISARIISLDNREPSFGEKITKSNNLQNRIEMSDFLSLCETQLRIKQELSLEGVHYSIKRDSDFKPSKNSFDVSECAIALACASCDPSLISTIKREISAIWTDTKKTPYLKLFNPSTSSIYVHNCVLALRASEEECEKILSGNKDKSFTYGALTHGNRIFSALFMHKIGRDHLASSKEIFDDALQKIDKSAIARDCALLLTSAIIAKHRNAILLNIFKSSEKCEDILYDCITPITEKNISNQSELKL